MAEVIESLVLVRLREIRAKLVGLDRLEGRFDKFEKVFDTLRLQLTHTFRLAGMANTQALRAEDNKGTRNDRCTAFLAVAIAIHR